MDRTYSEQLVYCQRLAEHLEKCLFASAQFTPEQGSGDASRAVRLAAALRGRHHRKLASVDVALCFPAHRNEQVVDQAQ